jgi:hypothetical protein
VSGNPKEMERMHRLRRVLMPAGLLMVAMLPLLAVVSSTDGAPPPGEPPAQAGVPVAIAQPLVAIDRPLMTAGEQPLIPESGMLILVGSALLGLASVVRRTTAR